MAIKVLNSTHEKTVGKVNYIRAEIIVDSAAELPAEINGNVLTMGSIAWDISTGDFYGLDSTGTWHNQTGEDTSQSNVSASTLQAPTSVNSSKGIVYQSNVAAPDTSDSEQPESVAKVAEPVEFTKEKGSEGTVEEMQPIPEDEPLTEVEKDAVRDPENR